MPKVRVDCYLEIKSLGDDGRIEGHAAVFGNVDLGLDRIERGAFRESLRHLKKIPMLWQHDTRVPIGVWDDMAEDKRGLRVSGDINLETQAGREARSLAKQGAVTGLSIGYIPRDFHFEDEVRVLKRVDVLETSLVTFPMNPEARVAGIKHASLADFERELREMGLSRTAAEAISKGGYAEFKRLVGSLSQGESKDSPSELVQRIARIKRMFQGSNNGSEQPVHRSQKLDR